MDYLNEARQIFAKDRFATDAAGITIEEVEPDRALCKLELRDIHFNARNYVMGGAMFTLADFGFAIASNIGGSPTVTLSSTIDYVKPGDGTYLTSETIKLSEDGRKCRYHTDIKNDRDDIIATIDTLGYRVNKE